METQPGQPERRLRIDPPGAVRPRRMGERLAQRLRARVAASAGRASARSRDVDHVNGGSSDGEETQRADDSSPAPLRLTLRDQLDAHARDLGSELFGRLSELDRREATLHADLAQLDAMRRELELWRSEEQTAVARERRELGSHVRAAQARRQEEELLLARRRREIDRAAAALADDQLRVSALQFRLKSEIGRLANAPPIAVGPVPPQRAPQEFPPMETLDPPTETTGTRTPGSSRLRIVSADGDESNERRLDAASTFLSSGSNLPRNAMRTDVKAVSPGDLTRLHAALLQKERSLADEARRLDEGQAQLAERRLAWIESCAGGKSGADRATLLAELNAVREELFREKNDRMRAQERRHGRMALLLEAIEEELKSLDLMWTALRLAPSR